MICCVKLHVAIHMRPVGLIEIAYMYVHTNINMHNLTLTGLDLAGQNNTHLSYIYVCMYVLTR